jgi:hypothetical protein
VGIPTRRLSWAAQQRQAGGQTWRPRRASAASGPHRMAWWGGVSAGCHAPRKLYTLPNGQIHALTKRGMQLAAQAQPLQGRSHSHVRSAAHDVCHAVRLPPATRAPAV